MIFQKVIMLLGLTKWKGFWVSAGIGMVSGFGLYKLAIISTVLTIFIFTVLWFLEQQLKKSKFFSEASVDEH